MSWKILKEKSDPFFISSKEELIREAYIGTISPVDLVQEPQSQGWCYAYEIEGLQFQDLDHHRHPKSARSKYRIVLPLLLFLLSLPMLGAAWNYYQRTPAKEELHFFTNLEENQGIISRRSAPIREDPSSPPMPSTLVQNETVLLEKKYKDQYLIRHPSLPKAMWIDEEYIIPLYLFTNPKHKEEWSLFFNTHTRIQVHNLSWSNPPKYKPLTAFYLQLQNTSPRFVHHIELAITLQNPNTQMKKTTTISIMGNIEPANSVSIGTLWDPKTQELEYVTESHYKEMNEMNQIGDRQWSPSINLDVQADFSEIIVQAVFAEIQN